jgi:TetR/AcrR family transcriptional regulator, cholesterol catabolism regulator
VQMRTVAERADVALGTLYRYFPSKIHLLVSALTLEFERTQDKLDRRPIPGETPYDRMLYVLSRVTRTMQREPMLTEAMTRAFMFADPSAAAEVNTVARQMERMFTRAMHDGPPTADDMAIARVIGDVWLSNLVAWVTRRASADDVSSHLELAARLLLRLRARYCNAFYSGQGRSAGAVVVGRGVAGRAVAVAGEHVHYEDGPADGDGQAQDNGDDQPDHGSSPSGWDFIGA